MKIKLNKRLILEASESDDTIQMILQRKQERMARLTQLENQDNSINSKNYYTQQYNNGTNKHLTELELRRKDRMERANGKTDPSISTVSNPYYNPNPNVSSSYAMAKINAQETMRERERKEEALKEQEKIRKHNELLNSTAYLEKLRPLKDFAKSKGIDYKNLSKPLLEKFHRDYNNDKNLEITPNWPRYEKGKPSGFYQTQNEYNHSQKTKEKDTLLKQLGFDYNKTPDALKGQIYNSYHRSNNTFDHATLTPAMKKYLHNAPKPKQVVKVVKPKKYSIQGIDTIKADIEANRGLPKEPQMFRGGSPGLKQQRH